MKYLQSFQLFESTQSQQEIEKIANTVIKYVIKNSVRLYLILINQGNTTVEERPFNILLDLYKPIYFQTLLREKELKWTDFSKNGDNRVMYEFLKTDLKIDFNYSSENSTTRGYYDSERKLIKIYIKDELIKNMNKELIEWVGDTRTLNDSVMYGELEKVLKTVQGTLVHELQHAFDDFKSKGKYLDSNFHSANYKMKHDAEYDDYYKLSHEISARYTQVVYSLRNKPKSPYGDYERPIELNWDNFLSAFKERFIGWNLLTKQEQIKLIKRLSLEYADMTKSKNPKSIDITEIVKKKQDDYIRAGVDISLHYYVDQDRINIYKFLASNEDQERNVIEDLVKLAETYRKVLTLNPYKGHTGIKMGSFIPMLKEFGFVGNGGKFGKVRTYKFMSNMVRFPVRKYKEIVA